MTKGKSKGNVLENNRGLEITKLEYVQFNCRWVSPRILYVYYYHNLNPEQNYSNTDSCYMCYQLYFTNV